MTLPCSPAARGGGSRPGRPAPGEQGEGSTRAWGGWRPGPQRDPGRAPRPPPSPSYSPASPPPARTRHGTQRGVSATDHTFLAEEGEERLVLLWGEQQGAHVGDSPRRLLARAHGVAGGVQRPGLSPREVGEHSVPLGVTGTRAGSHRRSIPPLLRRAEAEGRS